MKTRVLLHHKTGKIEYVFEMGCSIRCFDPMFSALFRRLGVGLVGRRALRSSARKKAPVCAAGGLCYNFLGKTLDKFYPLATSFSKFFSFFLVKCKQDCFHNKN